MTTTAYPLSWPAGWKRTPNYQRIRARFSRKETSYRSHNDGSGYRYQTTRELTVNSVAGNLAAIAATLNAMRAIERHGGAEILNRAFAGFAQLPAPSDSSVGWWSVLGVDAHTPTNDVIAAYRTLAKKHHPDTGGSAETFVVIQKAYEQFKAERGLI